MAAAKLIKFQNELNRLVETFKANFNAYQNPDYDETSLRNEFLTPLFEALGWDVSNRASFAPHLREVRVESPGQGSDRQKRADYEFRIERQEKFICEAKRPHEELSARYIFQTKNYAWNRGLPLAVLTDFEEFKIYIVGGRPELEQEKHGEYRLWKFSEYLTKAQELWDLLARDNVAAGSIQKLIESLPKKPLKGKARQQWLIRPDRTRAVDADFLRYLDEVRRELASDLYRHNKKRAVEVGDQLNEAVQRILDRILFLRICEDRDIDTGRPLNRLLDDWLEAQPDSPLRPRAQLLQIMRDEPAAYRARAPRAPFYRSLAHHFRTLDRRPPGLAPFFNGQLFKPHFSEDINVGDEFLANFIRDISAEDSPYLFNSLPVEILGSVYERFIGKIVRPKGVGVTIEDKPEVRKAGGVYYTPRYIVNYIVEQTVGQLLKDKPPRDVAKLRILDPACGSGSFLIRAYERVMEHYVEWLLANPKEQRPRLCYRDANGDLRLTTALKRKILTDNIFGVDIDGQAVEVTQLSLYLRMLQGETKQTMNAQRELLGDGNAILPPLDKNIKRGNSLIASDFSMIPEDVVRVHAFNWEVQFKDIMTKGGFDAVIGNPPYVFGEYMAESEKEYFRSRYQVGKGQYDFYHLFYERALSLTKPKGFHGYIVPDALLARDETVRVREMILSKGTVSSISHVGTAFHGVGVSAVVVVTNVAVDDARQRQTTVHDLAESGGVREVRKVEPKRFSNDSMKRFAIDASSEEHGIIEKVGRNAKHLEDFCSFSRGEELGKKHFERQTRLKMGFTWILVGEDVERFGIERPSFQIRKSAVVKDEQIYQPPKIVIVKTGERPVATLETNGRVTMQSLYNVQLSGSHGFKPQFFLGIINSQLVAYYLRKTVTAYKQMFPQFNQGHFEKLPIPVLDLKQPAERAAHEEMVGLVEKMLALKPKLRAAKSESERRDLQNAVEATDTQIDQLVYRLYGLTAKEIKIVEGEKK